MLIILSLGSTFQFVLATNGQYTITHTVLYCLCLLNQMPIIITKCTDGKHGNYDLTIIILWNNLLNLNFNVRLSDDSKK